MIRLLLKLWRNNKPPLKNCKLLRKQREREKRKKNKRKRPMNSQRRWQLRKQLKKPKRPRRKRRRNFKPRLKLLSKLK